MSTPAAIVDFSARIDRRGRPRRRRMLIRPCACASCCALEPTRTLLRTPPAAYVFSRIDDTRRFCPGCGVRFKNPNRARVCAVCKAKGK